MMVGWHLSYLGKCYKNGKYLPFFFVYYLKKYYICIIKNKCMIEGKKKNSIGVIIGRFQINELHQGHKSLIENVLSMHDNVIIFLGCSNVIGSRKNPLDFSTRYKMIKDWYGDVIILPIKDRRSDLSWSKEIDTQIKNMFNESEAILYGSRDSFIPHYKGIHDVIELKDEVEISATEVRESISKKIINSKDFRNGVIYSTYAKRDSIYSTVDVLPFNSKGQILLARKPDETKYRFIGGFVDATDTSDEKAAIREFNEETGGCAISEVTYITSTNIDDWRYKKERDSIMTRLFALELYDGYDLTPKDDIEELKWFDLNYFNNNEKISEVIVDEHFYLMEYTICNLKTSNLKLDILKRNLKLI